MSASECVDGNMPALAAGGRAAAVCGGGGAAAASFGLLGVSAGGGDDAEGIPRPIIVALRGGRGPGVPAGGVSLVVAAGGMIFAAGASRAAVGISASLSYALPASAFVFTRRSMTVFDGSSILMNFTPIPAGRSPFDVPASRFHTTRPTPAMTAWSLARRISNFSSVPGGNGLAVLM